MFIDVATPPVELHTGGKRMVFLLNPADYEVGGTRSEATKSLFLAVREGVGTFFLLVVKGVKRHKTLLTGIVF